MSEEQALTQPPPEETAEPGALPPLPSRHGSEREPSETGDHRLLPLSLAALGVVYGDIGTSPLYALRACFFGGNPVPINAENVLGVLSLIFWSLIFVISIKYLAFVMRADNRGEGGILALLALVDPWRRISGVPRSALVVFGIFGAALLYGDGMITPAISVLSAVEGLKVTGHPLHHAVLPITVLILIALFMLQSRGTSRVGAVFGPIMVVWFTVMGLLGAASIVADPGVLRALNPYHAFNFFQNNGWGGYLVLGGVFLVVTGGEALYADMGHFGRAPIRLAWFGLVLPALLLNYFGQGAFILAHPTEATHPFYNLVPGWAVYPVIGLATVATVIASQAVISGAFSLTRQAVLLGYAPRLNIVQTSSEEIGQIYVPKVNWALLIATVALVLQFRTSNNLTAAYGMAVSTTMVITTMLIFAVMWRRWHWRPLPAILVTAAFLVIDFCFLGANLFKFLDGGWLPLLVGVSILFLMSTWHHGRDLLFEAVGERSLPVDLLLNDLETHPLHRVPGTAVFLTSNTRGAPGALLHHLKLNQSLHENVLLLSVITEEVPMVPRTRRLEVQQLRAGFYRVSIHYGFMQTPNVPGALLMCRELGLVERFDMETTVYYLGSTRVIATSRQTGMRRWRKRLFVFMSRNSTRAGDFYRLPPGRTIELGVQVEI